MLNLESPKFMNLSDKAKLLLTLSIHSEKEIKEDKFFYDALGFKYPEDQMFFNGIITEIHNSKINYQLKNIKFNPPSKQEAIFYLQLNLNKITNTKNAENIEFFVNYFIDFYQLKKWKVGKSKMVNWKMALIRAVNQWNINFNKTNNSTTTFNKNENIMKSYEDFMNSEF